MHGLGCLHASMKLSIDMYADVYIAGCQFSLQFACRQPEQHQLFTETCTFKACQVIHVCRRKYTAASSDNDTACEQNYLAAINHEGVRVSTQLIVCMVARLVHCMAKPHQIQQTLLGDYEQIAQLPGIKAPAPAPLKSVWKQRNQNAFSFALAVVKQILAETDIPQYESGTKFFLYLCNQIAIYASAQVVIVCCFVWNFGQSLFGQFAVIAFRVPGR